MQKARRPHQQARQLTMREKGCYTSNLSVKAITCTQFEIRCLFKIVFSIKASSSFAHHGRMDQDHEVRNPETEQKAVYLNDFVIIKNIFYVFCVHCLII